MSPPARKLDVAPRRRRYLVHLFWAHSESNDAFRYIARIQSWASRIWLRAETASVLSPMNASSSKPSTRCFLVGRTSWDVLSHIENLKAFSISSISAAKKRRNWARVSN